MIYYYVLLYNVLTNSSYFPPNISDLNFIYLEKYSSGEIPADFACAVPSIRTVFCIFLNHGCSSAGM